MLNNLRTLTGVSLANTAKTHTISAIVPGTGTGGMRRKINIHSIAISTGGGDIAADCTVTINDNAVGIWAVEMRAGKVFGGYFRFDDYPITIKDGDCTIVTDAAGAGVTVTVSIVYSVI